MLDGIGMSYVCFAASRSGGPRVEAPSYSLVWIFAAISIMTSWTAGQLL